MDRYNSELKPGTPPDRFNAELRPSVPDTLEVKLWKLMGVPEDRIIEFLGKRAADIADLSNKEAGGEFLFGNNARKPEALVPQPGMEEPGILEKSIAAIDPAVMALGGFSGVNPMTGRKAGPIVGSASNAAVAEMMRGAAPAGRPRPSDVDALKKELSPESDLTEFRVTKPEPEPPNAGPDWFPKEIEVGTVRALNDRQAYKLAKEKFGEGAAIAGEIDALKKELSKSTSEPLSESETISRARNLPVSGKRSLSLLKEYGELLKSHVKNLTGVDVSGVDIDSAINHIGGVKSSFRSKDKRIEMQVMDNRGVRGPEEIFDTLLHEFAHSGSMRDPLEAVHLIGGTENFPLGRGVKAQTPPETGGHLAQNLIERAKFSNPDFQFLTRLEALKNDPSILALREKFVKDWYSTQND